MPTSAAAVDDTPAAMPAPTKMVAKSRRVMSRGCGSFVGWFSRRLSWFFVSAFRAESLAQSRQAASSRQSPYEKARASPPDGRTRPALRGSDRAIILGVLGGRTHEQWIAQYGFSHRHPVNRFCHTLGISDHPAVDPTFYCQHLLSPAVAVRSRSVSHRMDLPVYWPCVRGQAAGILPRLAFSVCGVRGGGRRFTARREGSIWHPIFSSRGRAENAV